MQEKAAYYVINSERLSLYQAPPPPAHTQLRPYLSSLFTVHLCYNPVYMTEKHVCQLHSKED
jgi:hypothetical protein